jgi:phenylacetate-coenzyme A ligase PaaK-like adenylate-forming protein
MTPPNLETILAEAQKQSEAYRESFRNLLAEETKTFEEFDKNGNLDEKTVRSNRIFSFINREETPK